MKTILVTITLGLLFSACVTEYNGNLVYAKGLNNGRIYDKNEFLIEKEAVRFNEDRTSTLDEYFQTKAKEILKKGKK